MDGWIKLHRKIAEWEWYNDANTLRLFLHLLINANHEPKRWHGMVIDKGQIVVGRKDLAKKLKVGEQSVRTSLNRLKSTNEITIKSTNKYSIVTILNWDNYQDTKEASNQQNNHQANQQLTSNQPTTNQQLTTNKNYRTKELKNNIGNRAKFAPPTLQEIQDYCSERKNDVDAHRFLNFYESKGWMIGKNKMKDWRAAVRTWESKEKKGFDKVQPKSETIAPDYSERF